MTTIYYTATTLDGFLADDEGSLSWLFGRERDEDVALGYGPFFAGVGALVMGATTYEWVLAHEPAMAVTGPYDVPTWVLTHRELPAPTAPTAPFAFWGGDVAALHPRLLAAADGKDVWVVGGGDLAGQFADAGLLDEVWLAVAPVTVGAGAPLLPRRVELELVSAEPNGAFADLRYRVLGPLRRAAD